MDSSTTELTLFRKWSFQDITVEDLGLKNVINLNPLIMPNSMGRHEHKKFAKSDVNIIERLVNNMMHFGKKHAKNTGRMGGKKSRSINLVKTSFDIISLETNNNPIQCLVKAVENAAPNEDTTQIAYGGVRYSTSVDISPQRRLDLALRFISEGVRETSFSNLITIEEALATEIVLASNNNTNSYAIKKKNEQERIAMSSR